MEQEILNSNNTLTPNTMNKNLFQISQEFAAIENLLEEAGGELTPELETALTISQNELQQKGEGYTELIRKFEANVTAADNRMKQLAAIKKQNENAAKNLKARLQYAMQVFNIEKISLPTCTIFLRKSKAVEVSDITLLPEKLVRTKVSQEPDKVEIKKAIEAGESIAGASIVENISLQIK